MTRHTACLPATLFAALLGAPGIALSCPTGADLAHGIAVSFQDGNVEIYRALKNGMVRATGGPTGTEDYQMDLAYGFYLLNSQNVENGRPDADSLQTTNFPMSIEGIPNPTPSMRWQVDVTLTDPGGTTNETQTFATGSSRMQQFGNCSYQVLDAIIHYDGENQVVDGLVYLPELGFGYLAWYQDEFGERTEYPVVQIYRR